MPTGLLIVVQGHLSHECLLQIFTIGKSVCLEHIGNAPIEAVDHAVGALRVRFGQAVFNLQGLAQLIEVIAGQVLALMAGEQPVNELLAAVGYDFLHLDRARLLQCLQKRASGRWTAVATNCLSNNRLMTPLAMNSGYGFE